MIRHQLDKFPRSSALFAAALLAACSAKEVQQIGTIDPGSRVAPLTPGARAALEARGATCTPNGTGPTLCTWRGDGVDCRLTFDATDALTQLTCTLDGLTWSCTRPGALYVCAWSDDPTCGEVYGLDGVFEARLCGAALDERIARSRPDAGVTPDAGPPPLDAGIAPRDAGVEDAAIVDAGASCRNLDEATCGQTRGCRADYCPSCNAGQSQSFVQCAADTDPPPPCAPPTACPCSGLDERSCDASSSCHPVYESQNNCGCAPAGCCTRFSFCADNAQADCSGVNLACRRVQPYCEPPFVVSYTGSCYEGCVRQSDCAPEPVICSGPGAPRFPTFDKSCVADRECVVVTHQTDCCGNSEAIGVNAGQQMSFDDAERICRSQYPACGCPARPPVAEDGQSANDPSRIAVSCRGGQCTSYVP